MDSMYPLTVSLSWTMVNIALVLFSLFFSLLLIQLVAWRFRMFTKLHGRTHSIIGACYLLILFLYLLDLIHLQLKSQVIESSLHRVVLDVAINFTGIWLTATAAFEFGHKNVKNIASGTLDPHATVTYNEMMEHLFYQKLNLFQVSFLHAICYSSHYDLASTMNIDVKIIRAALYVFVSSPWLVRHMYPVHPFSQNYIKNDPRSTPFIRFLYRMKKYQYMFYKHWLLFGLNVTVALSGTCLAESILFRAYWLLLNASYVMEFFLQTLVKKGYISQTFMLGMQIILMLAASVAAFNVLYEISAGFLLSLVSIMLNLVARKRDFIWCLILLALGTYIIPL